jgi:hypothetical protein
LGSAKVSVPASEVIPALTVDGEGLVVIGRGDRPRVIKIAATTMIITSVSTPINSPIAALGTLGVGAVVGGGRRGSLVVAADQAVRPKR